MVAGISCPKGTKNVAKIAQRSLTQAQPSLVELKSPGCFNPGPCNFCCRTAKVRSEGFRSTSPNAKSASLCASSSADGGRNLSAILSSIVGPRTNCSRDIETVFLRGSRRMPGFSWALVRSALGSLIEKPRKVVPSSADISSPHSCLPAPGTQPQVRRTCLRASRLSCRQYRRGSVALRPCRAG